MAWLRDILYAGGLLLAAPVLLLRMGWTGKLRTDWAGRFGFVQPTFLETKPPAPADARTVLIHAVSVGEVNACRDLVNQLSKLEDPPIRVVISATTHTGFARAQALFAPRHAVVRYPLDFSWAAARFLDAVKPDGVALIELEVWPNFVAACAARATPVCVVNGRLSARSFSRYRWVAPLLRPTFAKLAFAAVQTPDYARRFAAMGVPADRLHITDTMKWDTARLQDPAEVAGAEQLALAMGVDRTRPLIVAGSTGPGEEALLAQALADMPDAEPVQLMVVPRKPERFEEVGVLLNDVSNKEDWPQLVRRSQCPPGDSRAPTSAQRLYLLDTMGELRKAYALCDIAIVGRSLLGLHGSDPIEPIALGRPTLIGIFHSDFQDTVDAFSAAGGIEVTDQPLALALELLRDPARAGALADRGQAVIRQRQGASIRHARLIRDLLDGWFAFSV